MFKWFKTQKAIIKEVMELNKLVDIDIETLKNNLEELSQDKVYFLCLKDFDQEELNRVNDIIQRAAKKARWTIPNIIVSNAALTEIKISKKELKKLMNNSRKGVPAQV